MALMEEDNSRDEKGRLLPGHAGLKKKGSNNRLQSEIKEKITDFLNEKLDSIEEVFKEVAPKDKLRFLGELLGYVLPKSKEVSVEKPVDEGIDYTSWPGEDIKTL